MLHKKVNLFPAGASTVPFHADAILFFGDTDIYFTAGSPSDGGPLSPASTRTDKRLRWFNHPDEP
jgi:hypothetical protein